MVPRQPFNDDPRFGGRLEDLSAQQIIARRALKGSIKLFARGEPVLIQRFHPHGGIPLQRRLGDERGSFIGANTCVQ